MIRELPCTSLECLEITHTHTHTHTACNLLAGKAYL